MFWANDCVPITQSCDLTDPVISTVSNQPPLQARGCEGSGDYIGAIRSYLQLDTDNTRDIDMLEEAYEKAAELAYKFVPEKAAEVVSTVCQRLVQVNRHSVAADLYLGVDMITEAVQVRPGMGSRRFPVLCTLSSPAHHTDVEPLSFPVAICTTPLHARVPRTLTHTHTHTPTLFLQVCMDGDLWDRARKLADDTEDDGLIQHVKACYVDHLKGRSDSGSDLAQVDVVAGLDMLMQNGQWERCITEAAKHGGQVSFVLANGNKLLSGRCQLLRGRLSTTTRTR